MLKKFFVSFLGSLAGICVAGGILIFAFFALVGASVASSMEQKGAVKVKKGSVLRIELKNSVVDRQTPQPILDHLQGAAKGMALNDLVRAIRAAENDKNIDGILLDCAGGVVGLAQIQAIIDALKHFKESGKWIYSYGDSYTQGNYIIASVADSIYANPQAMVDIHGLSSTIMYFKDFLDKVGVKVQVVKVGTYKSAVEPFTLNDMSEANREQQEHYLGSIWNCLTGIIAENRGVDTAAVNKWADSYVFTADPQDYVKDKIVDRLVYRHEVDEMIAELTDKDDPVYIDVEEYIKTVKDSKKKGAKIAVLYALGEISDAGSNGITSEKLVPEILKLKDNDDIDGLILRVNSPGGSAFASEQIWEALQQFKLETGKPFYVSMSDVAASGGYYISCGADRIYAEPLTITGSIGIFGMIPDAQELLNDKLGINTATVRTNKTQLPDLFTAMNPELYANMQAYVNRGYETFVKRCADGRNMPVDSIKAIAEGRVWDGLTAKKLGLVDKLGGLELALADMAAELNNGKDTKEYQVKEFPKVKMEWWEELVNLNSQMKMRAVKEQLGDAMPYYEALMNIKSMNSLQCRMDYVMIK